MLIHSAIFPLPPTSLPLHHSSVPIPDKAETEEADEIRNTASSVAQLTGGESSAVLLLAKGYLALLDGQLAAARDSLQQGERKFSVLYYERERQFLCLCVCVCVLVY